MATGGRRDDAALVRGLARWMAARPDQVPSVPGEAEAAATIRSIAHADGGQANETVLVDLGPERPGVVVRLPPLEPTFPGYDLAPQAVVQNALAASGVPAPAPSVVVDDPAWIGAPFLAMPLVRGDIAGPAPAFDDYVTAAGTDLQRRMHDGLVDTVVAVHAVDWRAAGLDEVLAGTTTRDALDRWTDYVEWSSAGDPLPALAEALAWCAARVPPETEPVLLWGDVRLGNLVFDDERRVRAVLDWDLSSIGPAEMDLAWHLGLEDMMVTLFDRRVEGFPSRDEVIDRYERKSGRALCDLGWHEVFALVRALAINDRHQRISGDRHRLKNPMGAVLLDRLAAAT
jgi:aminoglycoside phosphotransferase (APT) family kinase protein